jgi:hypothetical protein
LKVRIKKNDEYYYLNPILKVNMFSTKECQVQEDIDSLDFEIASIAQKPVIQAFQRVNVPKRFVYRLRNPLETMSHYKERIINFYKQRKGIADSIIVPKPPNFEMTISGNRCKSVDAALKQKFIQKERKNLRNNTHENILPAIKSKKSTMKGGMAYDRNKFVLLNL